MIELGDERVCEAMQVKLDTTVDTARQVTIEYEWRKNLGTTHDPFLISWWWRRNTTLELRVRVDNFESGCNIALSALDRHNWDSMKVQIEDSTLNARWCCYRPQSEWNCYVFMFLNVQMCVTLVISFPSLSVFTTKLLNFEFVKITRFITLCCTCFRRLLSNLRRRCKHTSIIVL